MPKKECTLREKKFARTKIGLMNAFIDRLQNSRFDDISIREVCHEAEVAEGTFFNYFPEKIDVIRYYLQLLTLKMVWRAQNEVPVGQYLALINSFFSQTATELNNVNVIYQIISVLLVQREKPKKIEISAFEKQLAFPTCKGVEDSPVIILDDWLKDGVTAALKNGELPPTTNVDDVTVSLMTILIGTLLALKFGNVKGRDYHYRRQLQALWEGLGVRGQGKGKK